MLQKIQRKIQFVRKLLSTGATLYSKTTLFLVFLRLTLMRQANLTAIPFSCQVTAGGRSGSVYCTGSMGELHTLVDIFADHSYEPKHDHPQALFGGQIHTMLDLGANIGLASMWFALMNPGIRIDAYEPNPAVYALLAKNLAQFPHVRTFEKAIAATEGWAEFHQSEYTLASSMFDAGKSSSIKVATTTLDAAIVVMGGQVDLIKIDIEGAEFDALAACTRIRSARAIIGEAHTAQSGHMQDELNTLLASFDLLEIYNPEGRYPVFGFYAARTKNAEQ